MQIIGVPSGDGVTAGTSENEWYTNQYETVIHRSGRALGTWADERGVFDVHKRKERKRGEKLLRSLSESRALRRRSTSLLRSVRYMAHRCE
ncbi:hypothetical protein JZ751_015596 [Albula glossodonta]|uniref:Uncharacterized protein n=1 Tax=Albula glossodonta TaxID=121402 RepID=A0A8T2NRH3_9TELE|nr:hypothetical protein JZ751_015596 [Albula glossodonta]